MEILSVGGADNASILTKIIENAQKSDSNFTSYLNKAASGSYADNLEQIFQKAADTYNVSKELLKAMAKAESAFNANATSSSGAMGIMQLMPATAKSLGVTNAYDPEQNIMGGAKYISQLLKKYNGNLAFAIAAYNAGSGNVDKYGGIPPFSETKNYVAKVLKYLRNGVTIPDSPQSSTIASPPVKSATAAEAEGTDEAASSSGSFLQNLMSEFFDYEDYLDFLQLFTRVISEKINGTDAQEAQQTEEESGEQPVEEEQPEPVKQFTMTVRDSYGNIQSFRQEAVTGTSDAYKAYKDMTTGRTNHIAVQLTPSVE